MPLIDKNGAIVSTTKTANFNPATNEWIIDGGAILADNGYTFVPPLPMLTPMQYYLAFTPAERIAIKKSTDPVIIEAWDTYSLAAQLHENIDPNLVSVTEALTYMTTTTPPILSSTARIAQIQAGIAQ